uniref:Uncharacterized protein n=1 Tax=Pinguiococcus pyrenoidosus TaxID=172671 RepID=A0A6U0UCS3_9STRA|mmetsp:Transcript_15358/g.58448  ORF Transcript_15358/g.58448 Transcript_15358/m.58448 type:complete len:182 (+) Transcript_15358:631-1176(+)
MACAEHRIPWSDILSAALIGGDAQDGGEVAGTDGAQDGYWEDERETSDDDVVRDLTASDIDEGRMNAFLFAVEQASTLRSCRVDENQDRWALIQAVQDVYRQKANMTGKLPTKMKRMLARLVNVACSQSYVTTAYRSKVREGAMIPCEEAESRGNEHVYPEMYIRMLQPGKQVLEDPERFS